MRKIVAVTLLSLASAYSHAETIPVADDSICDVVSSFMRNCQPAEVTFSAAQTPDYVPVGIEFDVNVNAYCRSQFPTYVDIKVNGNLIERKQVVSGDHFRVERENGQAISVSIHAPYAVNTFYDKRCNINLDVTSDAVLVTKLEDNLEKLKPELDKKHERLARLIDSLSLTFELGSTLSLYDDVITLIEADLASFYNLNLVLNSLCVSQELCTWNDSFQSIIDNEASTLSEDQEFFIFDLSLQLDALLPAECNDGSCLKNLIDQDSRNTINDIKAKIPNLESLSREIQNYIEELKVLDIEIDEAKAVAARYSIYWDGL